MDFREDWENVCCARRLAEAAIINMAASELDASTESGNRSSQTYRLERISLSFYQTLRF